MNKSGSFNKFVVVALLLLLATIIGSLIYITVMVNQALRTVVSPINSVNHTLSTQVSRLLHPTPTIIPDPITIIREVQSLARLETIQYTLEKVITAEVNQGVFGPLFGDKLLFVAHGYVIAGVDLSKIEAADLRMEGDILMVNLPDSEVFVATLDNEDSFVYDRTTGLFQKSDPDLETSARQAAEQEILNAAIVDGILEQAQQNAEVYLERFFYHLGYKHVVFE